LVLVKYDKIYVCGIGLFSRDKGGACANEKWKRCNRVPSEITQGQNDPTAE